MKKHTKYRLTVAGKKLVVIMTLLCIAAITAVGSIMITNASEKRNSGGSTKYYSSMTVQDSDTLWDIAVKYHGDDETCEQYIDNIRTMNNIRDYRIHSGRNITYYYYGEAVNN